MNILRIVRVVSRLVNKEIICFIKIKILDIQIMDVKILDSPHSKKKYLQFEVALKHIW